MGLCGLFSAGQVEWISSMTYQSASGAGAKNMQELVAQMADLGEHARALLNDPAASAIALDELVTARLRSRDFPQQNFLAPLAGSLIPWIDSAMESGQTREEWKGQAETNKILDTSQTDSGRRHLRAGGCHALPQPGPDHQAQARPAPR